MAERRMLRYRETRFGAPTVGEVTVSVDALGAFAVEGKPVVDVRVVDLFSVLSTADGGTYIVLTGYFRLVGRPLPERSI